MEKLTFIDDRPVPPLYCPEKNLLAAILLRSLQDVFTVSRTKEAALERKRGLRFFFHPKKDSPDEKFSFLFICEVLNLSPIKILRFIEKNLKKHPKLNAYKFIGRS